ncbi:MAG TPA: hypothetical protein DD727_01410, partial [Clostridiales bacterium]|nr:hypothetical protein [Clostridiales bacterium]
MRNHFYRITAFILPAIILIMAASCAEIMDFKIGTGSSTGSMTGKSAGQEGNVKTDQSNLEGIPATIVPNPDFLWEEAPGAAEYQVEIALDKNFKQIQAAGNVSSEVCRYVPYEELEPGLYWWRVWSVGKDGSKDGGKSVHTEPQPIRILEPTAAYIVPLGSDMQTINRIMQEAVSHAPARVIFERGRYTVAPDYFIDLQNASDLVIDGNGAEIVITRHGGWVGNESASFGGCIRDRGCQRIVYKNFTFSYEPYLFSAGRITSIQYDHDIASAEI